MDAFRFVRRAAQPCALLLFVSCATSPERPFTVELEAAAVGTSRNDVAVPGDTGTRFPLDELYGNDLVAGGRVYLGWRPAPRQELRALYAPLTLSGTDPLSRPVRFGDVNFAAGLPTEATYRFDSYRLTYRYRAIEDDTFEGWIGFTAKIRDAEIELEQAGSSARKKDTGFVPLLHLAADWNFAEQWRLNLDVDGAWAPQGRAVDAALKLYWSASEDLDIGLGYRTVEGGADNDEVYTFSWIHAAVLSFRYSF